MSTQTEQSKPIRYQHIKELLKPWRDALYHVDPATAKAALDMAFSDDAIIQLSFPFETLDDKSYFWTSVFEPLYQALPDLERRDYIVIAGDTHENNEWVGCGGYYTGTFMNSWLDIPPTGHQVVMRFHEFYRFEGDQVVEMQALWDIPEVMMQAGCWPLSPSLGHEWHVPGPATQDGIITTPQDMAQCHASREHIVEMLEALKRHPSEGGPEVMDMPTYWHEYMNWYGPSGIGTGRGIEGFRNWHQIPFLKAMPDRGQYLDEINYHFFAEGNYAAVTGWPNMMQSITEGGWLGIAPNGQKISMRSLDFWRLENGKIRENWVLVDLLHMYHQIGVDVFARIREANKVRHRGQFCPETGVALV